MKDSILHYLYPPFVDAGGGPRLELDFQTKGVRADGPETQVVEDILV